MRDKMDHSTTTSPCLAKQSKDYDGFTKLFISLTSIFTHGYEDAKYAHFSVNVFPIDSNQTIGSIAKLLHDLENPPQSSNPTSLFRRSGRSILAQALLQGNEEFVLFLPFKSHEGEPFVPLSLIVHIQLDNY